MGKTTGRGQSCREGSGALCMYPVVLAFCDGEQEQHHLIAVYLPALISSLVTAVDTPFGEGARGSNVGAGPGSRSLTMQSGCKAVGHTQTSGRLSGFWLQTGVRYAVDVGGSEVLLHIDWLFYRRARAGGGGKVAYEYELRCVVRFVQPSAPLARECSFYSTLTIFVSNSSHREVRLPPIPCNEPFHA